MRLSHHHGDLLRPHAARAGECGYATEHRLTLKGMQILPQCYPRSDREMGPPLRVFAACPSNLKPPEHFELQSFNIHGFPRGTNISLARTYRRLDASRSLVIEFSAVRLSLGDTHQCHAILPPSTAPRLKSHPSQPTCKGQFVIDPGPTSRLFLPPRPWSLPQTCHETPKSNSQSVTQLQHRPLNRMVPTLQLFPFALVDHRS